MRRERLLRLDLPHIQVKERKSARGGGHICPTLMHGQSDIYVFEVVRYEHKRGNDDSGKRQEA